MRTPQNRRPKLTPVAVPAFGHAVAVTLVHASAVTGCRCTSCFTTLPRGAAMVVASRDTDVTGAFDVDYCSIACRASVVR